MFRRFRRQGWPLTLFVIACAEPTGDLGAPGDASSPDTGPRDATPPGGPDASPDIALDDAGPACAPEGLDGQPTLGLLTCNAMRAGDRRDFDLFLGRCCYTTEPFSACETWHIEPPTAGVTIGARGRVEVGSTVEPGTQFRVVARLGDGTGRQASAGVDVYDPAAHPLGGIFAEAARVRCEDGAETPSSRIGEIRFCGPRFAVTFVPFETRQDYWGEWGFDPQTGAISLSVSGGNYVPDGLDLDGRLRREGSDVVLESIWLGHPPESEEPEACGHRLAPR